MKQFYFVFIVFIYFSCTKENKKPSTQLQLKVTDKNSDLVAGAEIYLYNTETDWIDGTNVVYSTYTDSKGEAVLINLDAKRYYIHVKYNCLTNKITTDSDYTVIVAANTTTSRNLQLYGSGFMSFRNNYIGISILYTLSKNNKIIRTYTLAPLGFTPVFIFEDGFYELTVKNLANNVVTTFPRLYLECGKTMNISYP